jgi:hypothetical protein
MIDATVGLVGACTVVFLPFAGPAIRRRADGSSGSLQIAARPVHLPDAIEFRAQVGGHASQFDGTSLRIFGRKY